MIRVFIESGPCVGVEVVKKRLDGCKAVILLRRAAMSVVAFAVFVVVARDALIVID